MQRDPMVHIRIPEELKSLIAENAKANRRSLSSEIVFGLIIYARSLEQTEKAPEPRLGNRSDASQK